MTDADADTDTPGASCSPIPPCPACLSVQCIKDASSPSLSSTEYSCISDSFARFYESKTIAIKTLQEKMQPQKR